MIRPLRFLVTATALAGVLVGPVSAARAQPPAQEPTPPFAPAWGMLAGWDVFAKKGCGRCHALRGVGPTIGPDLGRIATGTGFYDLGAALWNHLPRMGEQMRKERIERPRLSPREAADLIAFLFTAQYQDESGDPKYGERVFAAKGCVQCHAVGGTGGNVGPALDAMKKMNSPVLVAAAMWNHGPAMAETMRARGIERPTFEGRELLDLVAYVVATATDVGGQTAQIVPGTPERGKQLFSERRCETCHSVGGKGGKVGPDLGRPGHHVSLTRFAGLMWNHAPKMWAAMKARSIDVPKLSGQDMADLLAYLYMAHYFDAPGDARRGATLVRDRGCLACHSVRGKGGKVAADFATSNVVGSPGSLIAGMWNHAALMEAQAQRQGVSWPVLQGGELADIAAYVNSLRPRPAAKPVPKRPSR
jgi:mono/diheme cytochrome c family protein